MGVDVGAGGLLTATVVDETSVGYGTTMVHLAFRPVDILALGGLIGSVLCGTSEPESGCAGPCTVVLVEGQSNALPPELREAIEARLLALGAPDPRVYVHATGGQSLEQLLAGDHERAVEHLRRLGVVPDAVLLVHGETDARTKRAATAYLDAAFGAGPESLVSRTRAEWPGVPLLVAELRDIDARYGEGIEEMRTAQREGCALAQPCALLEDPGVPLLADRLHDSAVGLTLLGVSAADEGRRRGWW